MKKIIEKLTIKRLKRNNRKVLKIIKKNIHLCDSKSGMYPNPNDYEKYCELNEKDLKAICKILGDAKWID